MVRSYSAWAAYGKRSAARVGFSAADGFGEAVEIDQSQVRDLAGDADLSRFIL
ncbi:hypothetical protein DFR50_12463 [Roseiarcus fermentans]|uniref:Uncharacterized protein n=1 Tax=Roseiarcus fermentans TaxID=1473586 RepID=A0A366F3E7_9HYPH|nr:hypothetical protein [Roseiarcus fermentans]RBP08676.1 hypothetical protein DFR50_12463 [Roseiarcus fermentans]